MDFGGLRVVILTYGVSGVHRPLLDSLRAEGIDPGAILVVHNPSTPDEPAPGDLGGAEVVRSSRNLGYAGGMNIGIEKVLAGDGELLLLLTHDARFRPGALAALVAAARSALGYAALGPALMLSGTETPFSYGGEDDRGAVRHRKAPAAVSDGISACDWIDGGTMLLRTDVLREVGGFDSRFWGYAEDVDLCLRIRRAGYGVGVVLAALADQDPGNRKRPGPWAYLSTRNGFAYAGRSAGLTGTARALFGALYGVAHEFLRAAVRAGKLRSGGPEEPWALAVGTLRGLVDAVRGRWGPPPPLPGSGDLTNASERSR